MPEELKKISAEGKKVLTARIKILKDDLKLLQAQGKKLDLAYEEALKNKQDYTDKVADITLAISALEEDIK